MSTLVDQPVSADYQDGKIHVAMASGLEIAFPVKGRDQVPGEWRSAASSPPGAAYFGGETSDGLALVVEPSQQQVMNATQLPPGPQSASVVHVVPQPHRQ